MSAEETKAQAVSPGSAGSVDKGAMGDCKVVAPKASGSKKKAAVSKPKKPGTSSDHPKYCDMIADAISHLKERKGSSRQAIVQYLVSHYKVGSDMNRINAHVKMALKSGVKSGSLKQVKGSGASGSFRLGERQKSSKKAARPKAVVKKPAAKKSKPPKTAAKKKAAAKKAKSPAKKPKAGPKKLKAAANKAKPKTAAKNKQKKTGKTGK